jgi:hypothetical protein
MEEDSLTILKYKLDDQYEFHVMDKFDYPDEVERLDAMVQHSVTLRSTYGARYKQLWIKTCPVFAIPQ